ncbi:hypothetical protein WJX81_003129 [Elliptochloris bilobata]|uniref:Uncharacterized protein n=1 Tax=Elliptochloris bilobata TaxID=381761 RepID=A0AAW1QXE9_9CHLO
MINPQVVLVASSTESTISAWDVHTSTFLAAFKANASGRNALSLLGRDYLVAAQQPKGVLHFWTWHKDQVLQRCFAAEPILALAASPDGVHLAGGGASGAIYLWETPSGRLLRSWPAHYKAVTALAFAEGGRLLLSAGGDTLAAAWQLLDVLDAPASPAPPAPLFSWAAHTLPVAGIWCGTGVAATVGLDRCCKLWSLAAGELLHSVALPAALQAVTADPAEHALYLGAADGRIFELSLVGAPVRENADGAVAAAAGDGSSEPGSGEWATLEGHARGVTSLACTNDGGYLLSGSEDGSVRVWELRSRQAVHVMANPAKGPVTGLLVLDRPPFLAVVGSRGSGGESGGAARKGPKRTQPLAPLCKFPGMAGAVAAWEGPPVILDGTAGYRGVAQSSSLLSDGFPDSDGAGSGAAVPKPDPDQDQQPDRAELLRELSAARADADACVACDALAWKCGVRCPRMEVWRAMPSQLHAFCIDQLLLATS